MTDQEVMDELVASAKERIRYRDLIRELVGALESLRHHVKHGWGDPKGGATHPKFFDASMIRAGSALTRAKTELGE